MKKDKEAPLENFEQSVGELEKLVEGMEKGDLGLEDQLKSFEKGVALSRKCIERLEAVERKVEELIAKPSGEMTKKPFDSSSN